VCQATVILGGHETQNTYTSKSQLRGDDNKQTNKQTNQAKHTSQMFLPKLEIRQNITHQSPETNGIAKTRATRTTAYCAKFSVSTHRVSVRGDGAIPCAQLPSIATRTYVVEKRSNFVCFYLFWALLSFFLSRFVCFVALSYAVGYPMFRLVWGIFHFPSCIMPRACLFSGASLHPMFRPVRMSPPPSYALR
jgi:hypothetical protein